MYYDRNKHAFLSFDNFIEFLKDFTEILFSFVLVVGSVLGKWCDLL